MRRSMVVMISLSLIGGACSSAGSFASGEIENDVGQTRDWRTVLDESEVCVVIEAGARSCLAIPVDVGSGEITLALGIDRGSTSIVGPAPRGTDLVQVLFNASTVVDLAVTELPDGQVLFAWAIDFSQETIPVTVQALDDAGAVLGSRRVDLAQPTS